MKNKIKLIDRLKSWLVTLGIASVFGLAALGVNAANSYQKASAYSISQNGTIYLFPSDNGGGTYDNTIFYNYLSSHYVNNTLDISLLAYIADYDGAYNDYIELSNDNLSYSNSSFNFYIDDTIGFSFNNTYSTFFDEESGDNFGITKISVSFGAVGYQELRNYVLSYNAPQNSGNFVTALTSFMSLIGGGIVDLAQTIGAGVVSFASGLFLDSGHLSILGGIIGIFAGIALAVGITSKVYAWVTTLGN